MTESASKSRDPVTPPLTGSDFVAWCGTSWNEYVKLGGVCEFLQMHPVAMNQAGSAIIEVKIPESLWNPMGMLHGGATALVLDEVGGLAVSCLVHFAFLRSTVEAKVTYFSRLRPGTLIARGKVVHRSGNLVFTESEMLTESGEVAAKSSSTFLISRDTPPATPDHERQDW